MSKELYSQYDTFVRALREQVKQLLGPDVAIYTLDYHGELIVDFENGYKYGNYYFVFRLSKAYKRYRLECCVHKKLDFGQAEKVNNDWLMLNTLGFTDNFDKVIKQVRNMINVLDKELETLKNEEEQKNGNEQSKSSNSFS